MAITFIVGSSKSGKTTLAKKILASDGGIHLDGDELRQVWTDLKFSKEDRYEQNLRAARLALLLESQGYNVIVSVICPYRDLRKKIIEMTSCRMIYLNGGIKNNPNHVFEEFDENI